MSYSISGTTVTVSGTVDLMNASLPSIYRINFAAGGANATFNARNFFYIPPLGVYFTVVGSASAGRSDHRRVRSWTADAIWTDLSARAFADQI